VRIQILPEKNLQNIYWKYDSLDKQIDSEVYKSEIRRGELYGLTENEIKIVEGG